MENYYQRKVSSFFGMLAGIVLSVFGRRRIKAAPEDFQKADFGTSTQRMGVRFNEKIRGIFRFKWIKRL